MPTWSSFLALSLITLQGAGRLSLVIAQPTGTPLPIYVYGTTLLLNAWGGTPNIQSGSPVNLNANAGAPATNEQFTWHSDRTISTPSANGVLCLDSQHDWGAGNPAPQQVVVWHCGGGVNQIWTYNGITGAITNFQTGYCLDASANGMAATKQLAVTPCNTNLVGQRFTLRMVQPPTAPTTAPTPLYVYGTNLLLQALGPVQSGSAVNLNENAGAPGTNELWTFNFDGTISTPSAGGVLCLDSQHTWGSNKVVVWSCGGGANQLWTYNANTGSITNFNTNYCLESVGLANGQQLFVAPCDITLSSQRFDTRKSQ